MKVLNIIALTLIVIGAINWGLLGLFGFNLVGYIFGATSLIAMIIYSLVGFAGLWSLTFYTKFAMDEE